MYASYPDRPSLEIRGGLSGAALVVLYTLWLLFAIAVVTVPCGLLALLAAHGQSDALAERVRAIASVAALAGVAAAFVIPVLLSLLQKTRRLTVMPLLPGAEFDFILCEEGIYVRQIKPLFSRNKCYALHPWHTLSLFVVKERRGRVGLRLGKRLLVLKANQGQAAGPYWFQNMLAIIMAHLPESGRTIPAKKEGFHWGILLVGLAVLFAADFAASMYFQHVSTGPVGDNRCDICGRGLVGFGSQSPLRIYDPNQDMKLVHEYCDLHALVDALIYPYPTIAAVRTSHFLDIMLPFSTTVLVWFWLIFCVTAISLPSWVKWQYRFAQ